MGHRIRRLLLSTQRKGITDFVSWLEKSDFFIAPASTRFHCCKPGGLAEHSLNVYKLLREKNRRFRLGLKEESIIISSLLHDLCKIDCYSENILKNGERSETKLYNFDDELPLGHGSKSVYLASQFIRLSTTEALLIRWHMGGFDYEYKMNADFVRKLAPQITAMQCSDMEARAYLDDDGHNI